VASSTGSAGADFDSTRPTGEPELCGDFALSERQTDAALATAALGVLAQILQ
jgi:hypothetical protein